MPNTPEADLQVESETCEPYRNIMIFRTLQRGKIVGPKTTTSKSFPAQTFYATLSDKQLPEGSKATDVFVSMDVEGVRALIDQAVPGQGLIGTRSDDDE